ncbi:MAG: hypothetical protein V3T47_03610 [Gammaproteobacteria bacterium]
MTYITTALTVACLITAGSVLRTANADETQQGDSDPGTDVRSSAHDGLDLDTQAESLELSFGALQDDWRVNFNTWIWLAGVEGEVGARGLTTDVSANFGDVLDASDSILAFSSRLEIAKGRWGGFIDGMYMNLGVDDVSGPLGFADIDITFEMFLIDFGATYRIGEWSPSGEAAGNSRDITLDLYAGGRYTSLDLELDPALVAARSRDLDWLDPIVGGKLVLPMNEKWHIAANGDVGGFGVESDFTWSATGVLGVDFSLFDHPATAYFGYRAIGWDFTEGSGSDLFTWDLIMHGPILGFSLLF